MNTGTSLATLALSTLLASVSLSCGGGGSGETLRQFGDEGATCLYPAYRTTGVPGVPDDSAGSFAAGEAVNVAVQFPVCLSSSCSKDAQASCSITRTGNTLRIVSSASFVEKTGPGGCTSDCGLLIARCTSEPLPAGAYRFEYGTSNVELQLPQMGPSICFARP